MRWTKGRTTRTRSEWAQTHLVARSDVAPPGASKRVGPLASGKQVLYATLKHLLTMPARTFAASRASELRPAEAA